MKSKQTLVGIAYPNDLATNFDHTLVKECSASIKLGNNNVTDCLDPELEDNTMNVKQAFDSIAYNDNNLAATFGEDHIFAQQCSGSIDVVNNDISDHLEPEIQDSKEHLKQALVGTPYHDNDLTTKFGYGHKLVHQYPSTIMVENNVLTYALKPELQDKVHFTNRYIPLFKF